LLSILVDHECSPFTVYSGIQQTGAGTIGADRPDRDWVTGPIERRQFNPTARRFFGGREQRKLLCHSIGIAGGTGPNSGALWNARRNTFAARHNYDFDFALVKTTPIGHRESGLEASGSAIRAELLICLTSSTWDYLRTSSRAQGLA